MGAFVKDKKPSLFCMNLLYSRVVQLVSGASSFHKIGVWAMPMGLVVTARTFLRNKDISLFPQECICSEHLLGA